LYFGSLVHGERRKISGWDGEEKEVTRAIFVDFVLGFTVSICDRDTLRSWLHGERSGTYYELSVKLENLVLRLTLVRPRKRVVDVVDALPKDEKTVLGLP
jgi:hypothetical protein